MAKLSAKREQALRYVPPLLGLAIALALITGALTLLPNGLRDFWWLIPVAAALGILVVISAVTIGTTIGQQIVGDRLEVAIKLPGTKWRHGRIDVTTRRLTFEPYLAQLRISTGQLEHYEVHTLERGPGRRPPLRSWLALNPGVRVLTLTTTTTQLEIAALPSRLETLRDHLHPHPRASPTR